MSLKDIQNHIDEEGVRLESLAAELKALVGKDGVQADPAARIPIHVHYKLYRDYIEHEDSLINNRLLWNINIQGFLFGTYGFAIFKLADVDLNPGAKGWGIAALRWIPVILPLLGIAISYFSAQGVTAAHRAIQRLKEEWEKAKEQHPADGLLLPGITGGGDDNQHVAGFRAPKTFPWMFIVAWALSLASYGGTYIYFWIRFG